MTEHDHEHEYEEEELTFEQLRALKVLLDRQFPSPDTMNFDPLTVVTDPSELSAQARQAATTHRHSVRMESDFKWLKRVGPALQVAYGSAVIGSLALTCYYGDLFEPTWSFVVGWILAGIGVAALVVVHLARAFLINRLGLSQERSGTTDPQ